MNERHLNKGEPRLLSDFDGTAVEVVSRLNPRNWLKYPLPMRDGYLDFLDGVNSAGVEIRGVVSCRPNMAVRRMATHRSIAKLGLDRYFNEDNVVHATREVVKAGVLIANSLEGPTGTIDDRPHKIGRALMHVMDSMINHESFSITLGVVPHKYRDDYVELFLEEASHQKGWTITSNNENDYVLHNELHTVSLTNLAGYSLDEGRAFGELIKS